MWVPDELCKSLWRLFDVDQALAEASVDDVLEQFRLLMIEGDTEPVPEAPEVRPS